MCSPTGWCDGRGAQRALAGSRQRMARNSRLCSMGRTRPDRTSLCSCNRIDFHQSHRTALSRSSRVAVGLGRACIYRFAQTTVLLGRCTSCRRGHPEYPRCSHWRTPSNLPRLYYWRSGRVHTPCRRSRSAHSDPVGMAYIHSDLSLQRPDPRHTRSMPPVLAALATCPLGMGGIHRNHW